MKGRRCRRSIVSKEPPKGARRVNLVDLVRNERESKWSPEKHGHDQERERRRHIEPRAASVEKGWATDDGGGTEESGVRSAIAGR